MTSVKIDKFHRLKALRAACQRSKDVLIESGQWPTDADLLIKHVSAVGALRECDSNKSSSDTEISERDVVWLEKIIKPLIRKGYPVEPNFEIDIVNIAYGRDFLLETTQTDLAVLCNIYGAPFKFNYARDWRQTAIRAEQHIKFVRRKINAGTKVCDIGLYMINSPLKTSPYCLSFRRDSGRIKIYASAGVENMNPGFYFDFVGHDPSWKNLRLPRLPLRITSKHYFKPYYEHINQQAFVNSTYQWKLSNHRNQAKPAPGENLVPA